MAPNTGWPRSEARTRFQVLLWWYTKLLAARMARFIRLMDADGVGEVFTESLACSQACGDRLLQKASSCLTALNDGTGHHSERTRMASEAVTLARLAHASLNSAAMTLSVEEAPCPLWPFYCIRVALRCAAALKDHTERVARFL